MLPIGLLPLGLAFWQDRRRRGLIFTRTSLAKELLRHPRQYVHYNLAVWRGLAWAGLILALAGPWTPSSPPAVVVGQPLDVLVVLDVSRSMRADDVIPNRLGAAKRFITALVARHPASRFGLAVFAGTSQARVPLTDDLEMFSAELAGTEVADGPGEGTALGDALALGVQRLAAAGKTDLGISAQPLLILVTDGANHAGRDPAAAAGTLAQAQIGLGVVGVGLDHPTIRREWDEITQTRRPLQDAFGHVQTWEPLELSGLQHLAARGAPGIFVNGNDVQAAAVLDSLWKPTISGPGRRARSGQVQQWFWLPLAGALLALGFEFVLAKTVFRRLQDA